MINAFVQAWGENEKRLTEYLKAHLDEMEYSYLHLVQIVFDEVINPYMEKNDKDTFNTDEDEITQINNGDYQGTLIFALHVDTYSAC